MRAGWPLLLVLFGIAFPTQATLDPRQAGDEYTRLTKWQFSSPITLAEPVTLSHDTAIWTLESGSVRLLEPASDGTVTGVVFEGKGRFRMTIPDRYELAQLRRFTGRQDLAMLDVPFTQLVLRTSDASTARLFPPAGGPYSPCALATKRHEAWLVDLRSDADARVLLAMLNPDALQLIVSANTNDFGWLTYEYDSSREEEISLTHFQARLPEMWVSLDKPGERGLDGRPSEARSAPAALEHIDVKADLTHAGKSSAVSRHGQRPIGGRYIVDATFLGIAEETNAMRLGLLSRAYEFRAFGDDGQPLAAFRDHVGKRAAALDNRIYDDDFVVVLPRPLRQGEKQRVRFEYELETANYAPGGGWYPMFRDALQQLHTARLELTVRRRNELRAMGKMISRKEDERGETSVWVVDRPAKMITFSTATRFEEVKIAHDGIPSIVAFGPDYQIANTAKMHNVGADVANSIFFFQKLLDTKIVVPELYVTSVAGSHGQAFDGFLHLGEFTFASERSGASELFRAHEVAHEWWGHKVGWSSYRDQWLSEAFAEYCAMLFVQQTVKGGDKFFEEILRSYTGIVRGDLAGGFSKFNRPWLIERNAAERARLGPIGHGRRAATRDMPLGYTVQTYHKGPLVLHMLRALLFHSTQSDALFLAILRDFVQAYDGKAASTEDFRRTIERHTGTDWGWFFDAWIYGADVPSYSWKWSSQPATDGFALKLDLERRNVRSDFAVVIPVRVAMENGKHAFFTITSRDAKQSVTRTLPSKPKTVEFAPDYSLLATIRRD